MFDVSLRKVYDKRVLNKVQWIRLKMEKMLSQ